MLLGTSTNGVAESVADLVRKLSYPPQEVSRPPTTGSCRGAAEGIERERTTGRAGHHGRGAMVVEEEGDDRDQEASRPRVETKEALANAGAQCRQILRPHGRLRRYAGATMKDSARKRRRLLL